MRTLFRKKGSGCCVAVGCSMRKGTNLLSAVRLFKFPQNSKRRLRWEIAVRRMNWKATKNSQLCNLHFVTGQPSPDPLHPDYVPSLFNYERGQSSKTVSVVRYGRHAKQIKTNVSPFKAGINGLKRRKLKRNVIPSCNLPSLPEYTDKYEDYIKLENTEKSLKRKIRISDGLTEDESKLICLDSTDSHGSSGKHEVKCEASVDDINKKHMNTTPSIVKLSVVAPNCSDIDTNAIEHTSENLGKDTQDCTIPLSTVDYKQNSDFDYSEFKSSSDDSKEILTQKLDTMLSINAVLQKKIKFYQSKCKIYEKEVNILKGVIDNLKLINSVTFGD